MSFCSCGSGTANTGTGSQTEMHRIIGLLLVPIYGSDGTRNHIAASDVEAGNITEAWLTAKLEAADTADRWYPVMNLTAVTDTRNDPSEETFDDNSTSILIDGARRFSAELIGYAPSYLKKIGAFKCGDFGIYEIDSCGKLRGTISKDGTKLYPTRTNSKSMYESFMKASTTQSQRVMFRVDYSQLESDANLALIKDTDVEADFTAAMGLIDLKSAFSSPTTTGFNARITLDSDLLVNEGVTGFVLADFTVKNIDDNAAVTVTSVTDNGDGNYAFVIPAQDAGEKLEVSLLKNGKILEGATVTIPSA
ncbi:MAG: hypothetical protein HRU12_08325 [Phaeodactylibacter sp.]|nr:hypothetical protein [Phaeodactylibacter sp.]